MVTGTTTVILIFCFLFLLRRITSILPCPARSSGRSVLRTDRRVLLALLAGFLMMISVLGGGSEPVHAADQILPVFGKSEKEIRVYTDYFCPPCQTMEDELAAHLLQLQGSMRVVFVDLPINGSLSLLYIDRFLRILPRAKTLSDCLALRRVLFEAAKKGIKNPDELDRFLAGKGYVPGEFDKEPVFRLWTDMIQEDRPGGTPTVVFRDGEKFRKASGIPEVRKLFKKISRSEP
jgi:thiol:disulfide interchange protein DsbA